MKRYRRRCSALRHRCQAAESLRLRVAAPKAPNPEAVRRGNWYLVDMGKLIQVLAVSAQDAFYSARVEVFGPAKPDAECARPVQFLKTAMVYQLDASGNAMAVFD